MRYFGKLSWWCLSLLLVLGWQTSYATSEFPSPVKNILLEPITDLTTDGPVKMSMTVIPKEGFGDTLTFQIAGTHGLVPIGPDTRTVLANNEGNFETEFEILIPKNDTSRLTVHIVPGQPWIQQARFFVTMADTVEYYRIHPKDHARRVRPQSDWKAWSAKWPESVRKRATPPDSNTYRFRTEAAPRSEYQLLEMRRIEESPLTDAQVQYFNVGDSLYRRHEGEKEFTLVPKRSMDEILAVKRKYLDSIAQLPPEAEIRVCLDLRRPGQLESARQRLGSLGTPESESYYHQTISKAILEQLKKQGVPIMYLDLEDIVHRPHPSERSDPSAHRRCRVSRSQTELIRPGYSAYSNVSTRLDCLTMSGDSRKRR